jgi:hypothetical protein
MEVDVDVRAYQALSQHTRIADLAAITGAVMTSTVAARRMEHPAHQVKKLAGERRIAREDAATSFGNALDVLERGPESDAEGALTRALAAHALALRPPEEGTGLDGTAAELLWLAANTPFDATGLIDRALGERAAGVWDAIADRIRRFDRGSLPAHGRGEALVAAVALSSSSAPSASRLASALAAEAHDQKLARVLGARVGGDPLEPVLGQMAPGPWGAAATTVLAMTGILFVVRASSLFGSLALAYKRPAQIVLADDGGVRVRWRIEMLGRTLRDRDVLVPRAALVRATREVRYPRFAFYAGLLALAVGSYLGMSAFVDGVRSASPSLLAAGLAIAALGVALDFVLTSVAPGARGRCRILFVPRDGRELSIGGVDVRRADALLARLARG